MIICENDIFGNTYGDIHDLLVWKILASLIKFLKMDFISYCIICKIKDALIFGKIDTKSSCFENFVNILDISKVFVKLLEIELCFDFM